MIDLTFHPAGMEMTGDVLECGDKISVVAVETPVMALVDILRTKLHALNEHALDYSSLLGIARALRVQIDWQQLRDCVDGFPYATAFFTLAEELGIAPRRGRAEPPQPSRVRVVTSVAS